MLVVHISVPLLDLITFRPFKSPPQLDSEDETKELGLALFSFPGGLEYLGLCGYCLVG